MPRSLVTLALLGGCFTKPARPVACEPGPPRPDPCVTGPSVPAAIKFVGLVSDNDGAALPGRSVDLEPGGFDTSDEVGYFEIDVATNHEPLAACVAIAGGAGYQAHQVHYQRPFAAAAADVSMRMLSSAVIGSLYTSQGVVASPTRSTLVVSILDCADARRAGETVAAAPPAVRTAYVGDGASTNATGLAFLLDVEPGTVALSTGSGVRFDVEVSQGEVFIVNLLRP